MHPKIKVLVADDHKIVRIGLVSLLKTVKDLEVVGEASDGNEAIALAQQTRPDVAVIDLMMPQKDGIAATAEIHALLPETRILILTTFGTSDGIARALASGAIGAVMKTADDRLLIEAIREVAAGHRYLSDDIQRLLADDPPIPELTERQSEILRSITRGLTNADIAKLLGIREDSVKKLVATVCSKIGAANRTEAAVIALRKHLLKV